MGRSRAPRTTRRCCGARASFPPRRSWGPESHTPGSRRRSSNPGARARSTACRPSNTGDLLYKIPGMDLRDDGEKARVPLGRIAGRGGRDARPGLYSLRVRLVGCISLAAAIASILLAIPGVGFAIDDREAEYCTEHGGT